jgi:hypothetical protein
MEAGADGCLATPFDAVAMRGLLARLVGPRR